jgi:hypothetical protein
MAEPHEYREVLLWDLASIGWTSDSPDLVEAMILLASIHFGANEALIAEKLGLPFDYVSAVGTRLRDGGIWVDDQVTHAGRWPECLTTFLMDVMVASGQFKCFHEGGEPKYHLAAKPTHAAS